MGCYTCQDQLRVRSSACQANVLQATALEVLAPHGPPPSVAATGDSFLVRETMGFTVAVGLLTVMLLGVDANKYDLLIKPNHHVLL
jgi:hypothetical protein